MKKVLATLCALTLIVGAFSILTPTFAESAYVDAYTSASPSKTTLEGEALDAAVELLVGKSSDLATLAETQAEGYAAPESAFAQIMSVNPDGSIGLSTISQWKYIKGEDGKDQVKVALTYGQNQLNLSEVGKRGSLLVKIDELFYIVHLSVVDVQEMAFDADAFAAGAFNAKYSGAEQQLSSFDITMDVLSIESTGAIRF